MGLRENILTEPVSQLGIREALTVRPGCSVRDAVGLMRRKGLGCVIIVDDQGKPIGTFTERVMIRMLLSHEGRSDEVLDERVENYMVNNPWEQVKLSETIASVIEKMQNKSLRFIVVIDDEGRAVGLTGQKGVMEYIAEHFPRQVKVQPMQSKVAIDQREGA